MSISDLFIKRPIMTTLVMAAILIFGIFAYRLLPVSDLPNVDFPTILVSASLAGSQSRDHGFVGCHAAGEAVLDDRRHRLDDVDEFPGPDQHHDSVQSQPQPRWRCTGRAGGDHRGRGAIASADADAADVSEGESGRFAHPVSGAEFADA